ncbi:hypothetical protein SDC9_180628 [bioreactor metagenome]|uniref:Uncharacterized protein n=1 Tax=bioreactor metagenome TaxID=1076179 RepID=A0A645H2A2_9ZZZZ
MVVAVGVDAFDLGESLFARKPKRHIATQIRKSVPFGQQEQPGEPLRRDLAEQLRESGCKVDGDLMKRQLFPNRFGAETENRNRQFFQVFAQVRVDFVSDQQQVQFSEPVGIAEVAVAQHPHFAVAAAEFVDNQPPQVSCRQFE